MRKKILAVLLALCPLLFVGAVASPASAASGDILNISLWSLNSHKCLDVPNSSTLNNLNIIQYTCNGSAANQRWDMHILPGNYYELVSRATGKCLDVRGASQSDSADVIQYTCSRSLNQQWGFQSFGPNYYYFYARHSGKCADIENARTYDGALLIQYSCSRANNQLFQILP